jgi:HD-GYP domain-containing protein (c-di-GMP phosphodiesterase class II)
MISERAYRQGMEFDAAIEQLLKDSGHRYDRGVIAALINRLDNRGGREQWAAFRAPPMPGTA